jgi:hypothetical protein
MPAIRPKRYISERERSTTMMVFRGCAKCDGDLYVERNLDGADLVCLQCGSRKTVTTSRLVPARHAEAVRELQEATR